MRHSSGHLSVVQAGQVSAEARALPWYVEDLREPLPFYSNTTGSPIANSTLTMMMETKPIERKGRLSTSVTRSIKRRTSLGAALHRFR